MRTFLLTCWLSWMLASVAVASPLVSAPGEVESEWLATIDPWTTTKRCEALRAYVERLGSAGEEVVEALAECTPEGLGEPALEQANP